LRPRLVTLARYRTVESARLGTPRFGLRCQGELGDFGPPLIGFPEDLFACPGVLSLADGLPPFVVFGRVLVPADPVDVHGGSVASRGSFAFLAGR